MAGKAAYRFRATYTNGCENWQYLLFSAFRFNEYMVAVKVKVPCLGQRGQFFHQNP